LVSAANASDAHQRIIILDCCHSGHAGNLPFERDFAGIKQGVSILAACRAEEIAVEDAGHKKGKFTSVLIDGLQGGAADVLGGVTLAGLYSYLDVRFSCNEQRPMFKCHLSRLIQLRHCQPAIDPQSLREGLHVFKHPGFYYPLDKSYEETEKAQYKPENGVLFKRFQRMRAARLLEPVDEEHLYYAAINGKPCRLTPLGQHYWELWKKGEL
jgi:hypothetical protein